MIELSLTLSAAWRPRAWRLCSRSGEETKDNRLICDARRDAKRRLWEMEEKNGAIKKNKYPNEQILGEGADGWAVEDRGSSGFNADRGWW